jgi:two-component system KDP operon response regulator KdpE
VNPLILIVEDDKHTRALFQTLLARTNFRTAGASTVEEALAHIRQEQPAAILLDLGLPGTSGLELLKTIRQDKQWQRIKVIIVSAYRELMQQARQIGADAYLLKPINTGQFLQTLEDVLSR